MKTDDREILKRFYKNLTTPKERDFFYNVLKVDREQRILYIKNSIYSEKYVFDAEFYEVLISVGVLTKEDITLILTTKTKKETVHVLVKLVKWFNRKLGKE